jgi:hypothetical protein
MTELEALLRAKSSPSALGEYSAWTPVSQMTGAIGAGGMLTPVLKDQQGIDNAVRKWLSVQTSPYAGRIFGDTIGGTQQAVLGLRAQRQAEAMQRAQLALQQAQFAEQARLREMAIQERADAARQATQQRADASYLGAAMRGLSSPSRSGSGRGSGGGGLDVLSVLGDVNATRTAQDDALVRLSQLSRAMAQDAERVEGASVVPSLDPLSPYPTIEAADPKVEQRAWAAALRGPQFTPSATPSTPVPFLDYLLGQVGQDRAAQVAELQQAARAAKTKQSLLEDLLQYRNDIRFPAPPAPTYIGPRTAVPLTLLDNANRVPYRPAPSSAQDVAARDAWYQQHAALFPNRVAPAMAPLPAGKYTMTPTGLKPAAPAPIPAPTPAELGTWAIPETLGPPGLPNFPFSAFRNVLGRVSLAVQGLLGATDATDREWRQRADVNPNTGRLRVPLSKAERDAAAAEVKTPEFKAQMEALKSHPPLADFTVGLVEQIQTGKPLTVDLKKLLAPPTRPLYPPQ